MNTYAWLGLPGEISITLFMVTLSIALAPYFGGAELGSIKIPRFSHKTTRSLKHFGWLPLLLATAAFYPLWPGDSDPDPAGTFSATIKLEGQNGTLDCAKIAGATVVLSFNDDAFRDAVGESCGATIRRIPDKYQNSDAWITVGGAHGFVRSGDDS